jgi:hypothetical protein
MALPVTIYTRKLLSDSWKLLYNVFRAENRLKVTPSSLDLDPFF